MYCGGSLFYPLHFLMGYLFYVLGEYFLILQTIYNYKNKLNMKKTLLLLLVTLLLTATHGYAQRTSLIYQDALTHTTVKWALSTNAEYYVLGARNGKLWTKKLYDITVYKADYHTIIASLQAILDFVNSDPSKKDTAVVDGLKVQYKRVAGIKCIAITNKDGITIHTSSKVAQEVLDNILIWENKKYIE